MLRLGEPCREEEGLRGSPELWEEGMGSEGRELEAEDIGAGDLGRGRGSTWAGGVERRQPGLTWLMSRWQEERVSCEE